MQLQYPFWSRSIDGGAFFSLLVVTISTAFFLAEIDFHNDFSCWKAYWIMINDDADDAEDDDDDDVDGWI